MDCSYGIRCSDVKQDLDRIGIEVTCDTCLDVFCHLAEEGGSYNAFVLAKLGAKLASVLAVRNDADVWENAICVHTRMNPVGMCKTESCLAWIDHEQTGNCFRVFTRNGKPTVRDISCTLGVTEYDAKDILDRGRALAARHYLKESVNGKSSDTTCCACGRDTTLELDGWGYCSSRCAMDKPPLYQAIEARFGKPLRAVLERIKKLDSIIPEILGVDQRTSDLLYRRLGVSLETALALRSSRSETYRGQFTTYDRFAVDFYEEHGYPTSPRAEDIRKKMDALVDNLWRHRP